MVRRCLPVIILLVIPNAMAESTIAMSAFRRENR
jgi:hypothetical protein